MKKTIYNPEALMPPLGHFERAVRLGDWLFISGTSAVTNSPNGIKGVPEGIEAQTQLAIDNLEIVLDAAGAKPSQIYEIRYTLKDGRNMMKVDQILKARWPEKGFIGHGYQGALMHPAMEIEIEANAYLGDLESVERVGRPG